MENKVFLDKDNNLNINSVENKEKGEEKKVRELRELIKSLKKELTKDDEKLRKEKSEAGQGLNAGVEEKKVQGRKKKQENKKGDRQKEDLLEGKKSFADALKDIKL